MACRIITPSKCSKTLRGNLKANSWWVSNGNEPRWNRRKTSWPCKLPPLSSHMGVNTFLKTSMLEKGSIAHFFFYLKNRIFFSGAFLKYANWRFLRFEKKLPIHINSVSHKSDKNPWEFPLQVLGYKKGFFCFPLEKAILNIYHNLLYWVLIQVKNVS